MMNLFKTILLVAVLCINLSCHKEENHDTWVRGKVTNLVTGQSLEGFEVILYEKERIPFEDYNYRTVKKTFPNVQGEYNLDFNSRLRSKYLYEIEVLIKNKKHLVTYYNDKQQIPELKKKEDNIVDIGIVAAGSLIFKLSPPPHI